MIKFENTEVVGWEHAIRGMRNPMNSWDKSDSGYCEGRGPRCETCPYNPGDYNPCYFANMYKDKQFVIGPNDINLMKKLRKAGVDHRKYLRFIDVYVDITAPLYWWKEFKTYRKDRVFIDNEDFYDYDDYDNELFIEMNSCSTMHKIHSKEFTLDDFAHDHLISNTNDDDPCDALFLNGTNIRVDGSNLLELTINVLNYYRNKYLETKDKKYWYQMIQLLPSSYMQKRTIKLNYEVLNRMYKSRKNHKLDEWKEHNDGLDYGFCDWIINELPYSELITGDFDEKGK